MQDNKDEELEVNKINREQSEKIMNEGSRNLDNYWDIHNPVVMIILGILGFIVVVGAIYYFSIFLDGKY